DCETVALVGRDGSIDWLCFPRFDSGACFAALLGEPRHGRWLIAPAGEVRAVRRRYRDGTLVLETEFETDSGLVTLTDCLPGRDGTPNLVRLVEGKRGEVAMRKELILRFDYGSIVPWVQRVEGGIWAIAGPDSLRLQSGAHLVNKHFTTTAEFTVKAGQKVPFALCWHPSYQQAPAPIDVEQSLRETEKWWRDWSGRCTYRGPWRDAVLRSLITLKALTYEPTGGVLAAGTTSLPEQLGGVRNWDYRYC